MVIGIITTYVISAHHYKCCEFESRSSEKYSIPHYVMKFVSDLREVADFLRVLRFPPVSSTNKTVRHDITEILLKVVLNTINLALTL